MHGPMGHQNISFVFITNILQRSKRFTEQSFAMENKFLPRTVLRSFLHKLEWNLMQRLELASIVL